MKSLLLFVSFLAFVGNSQVKVSANTKADVSIIINMYETNGSRVTEQMKDRFPITSFGGVNYVSFLATVSNAFSKNEFESRGIKIGSQIKNIVSIRYPLDALDNIYEENDLSYLKLASKLEPLLDKVSIGTRIDSVWAGIGLPQSYTGKDVILGINDWGFDYTNPMFYDTLISNYRIIKAWDQKKTSGTGPAAYGYGSEYANFTELQAAVSDTTFNQENTYGTHGTHVAGIAGGGGAGTALRGMAFESEYVFVSMLRDESFVLDAYSWMYEEAQAQGKHLVVNMSYGAYVNALDGSDVLTQAIDAYTDLGVLFCIAAANNGNVNFHIAKTFASDSILTRISFYALPTDTLAFGESISMWGEPSNSFDCQVVMADGSNNILNVSDWYSTATVTSYVDTFVISGLDTVYFNLSADAAYPSNGCPQMRLKVKTPTNGIRVGLRSRATSGTVHYWNLYERANGLSNWGQNFMALGPNTIGGDDNYGVAHPGCAAKAITVGAYSSEFYSGVGILIGGSGASFTSKGPLIDGALKPDVSAPGVNVASSISSVTDDVIAPVDQVDFNGTTYIFGKLSGTSMSSPVVTGVSAVIWEANPYLTPWQVKDIVIQTARTDSYTGAIPPHSTEWGWGKLNAYAAVQLALTTIGLGVDKIEKEYNWTIYPNPTSDLISFIGVEGDVKDVKIIDFSGKVLYQNEKVESIDCSVFEAGVYFVRIIRNGKVEQLKFVKK